MQLHRTSAFLRRKEVTPLENGVRNNALRRRVVILVALVLGLLGSAGVAVATGATARDPGVSPTTIKIGGTFPLSGPASLYAVIPTAEKAYFSYVNAKGGVNGRKIQFIAYNDAYDPSQTVPMTQKLVMEDRIFANFGSLGTAPALAVRPYLNKAKVPQVLVATGDSYWGAQYKKYPWTIGFQPDYPGEAKIYGKFIRVKVPQAKIGVLYQNDAYGVNYLNAFKQGLGAKAARRIVDAEPFDVNAPDVVQQMLKLKASGANVYVDFATPTPSIKSLATATKIGWHPSAIFVNNISASANFMSIAAKAGADIDGALTATYVKNPNDPTQTKDAGVRLYRSIMAKYFGGEFDPKNANLIFGVASAWTMVYALEHAGKTPTRAGLMHALTHLNTTNPFLLNGIKLVTTPRERFPVDQQTLERWKGGASGDWVLFGGLYKNAR
jgi:branched-chain amino acid transport system substrate-binding protein